MKQSYFFIRTFFFLFLLAPSFLKASSFEVQKKSDFITCKKTSKSILKKTIGGAVLGASGVAIWTFLSSFDGADTMDEAFFQAHQAMLVGAYVGGSVCGSLSFVVSTCIALGFDLGIPDSRGLISRFPKVKPDQA